MKAGSARWPNQISSHIFSATLGVVAAALDTGAGAADVPNGGQRRIRRWGGASRGEVNAAPRCPTVVELVP